MTAAALIAAGFTTAWTAPPAPHFHRRVPDDAAPVRGLCAVLGDSISSPERLRELIALGARPCWRPRVQSIIIGCAGEDELGFVVLPKRHGDRLRIRWMGRIESASTIHCSMDAVDFSADAAWRARVRPGHVPPYPARTVANVPDDVCKTTDVEPLGAFPDNRALFLNVRLPHTVDVQPPVLIAFDTGASTDSSPTTRKAVSRKSVELPRGLAAIRSAALAPDGRAIIWSVTRDMRSAGALWLATQLGRRHPDWLQNPSVACWLQRKTSDELWLSDAAGQNFRPIAATAPGNGVIEESGWLADGRIGFTIGSSDYAIAP